MCVYIHINKGCNVTRIHTANFISVCVCDLFLRKLNTQVGGDARNNMVLEIYFFVYDKSVPTVIFAFSTSPFIIFP